MYSRFHPDFMALFYTMARLFKPLARRPPTSSAHTRQQRSKSTWIYIQDVLMYWWALNYRKNSIIGCRVISRTSNADLRNLNTVSSAAWKIKATQEKCQITTNNKHFTVANVHPPFPPTICTCGGSEELQNLKLFFLKLATILHLSYSQDILI